MSCLANGCHGVDPNPERRGETIDWARFHVRVDRGQVVDVDQALDAMRGAIGDASLVSQSPLLRKTLDPAFGGVHHEGGATFGSDRDPRYLTLMAWIEREVEAGTAPLPPPLSALERQFADTVQPMLLERGCATRSCHGPSVAVPFRLEAPPGARFSISQTRHNYGEARTMLSLGGDGAASRLLVKGLPLHRGGILHKGGNLNFFSPDDVAARAIVAWACAERLAATGSPCGPPDTRVVFVRGPAHPLHPLDLEVYAPGTHLVLAALEVGAAGLSARELGPIRETLGAALDARDPGVDPTGRWLAYALRRGPDEGHHLVLHDLATGTSRPLTPPAKTSDREPTFGPGGRVWFVSNRSGLLADDPAHLDSDLYSVDLETSAIRRWTFTPQIERRPIFFVTGVENGGELAFTALRNAVRGQRRAHVFRFPQDLGTEYHQHFGITPAEDFFTDQRELPDGRYVTVLGTLDEATASGAGSLGLVDRNIGPELRDPGASSSLPFYGPPLVRLGSRGLAPGFYRDPAPLPSRLGGVDLLAASTPRGAEPPDFAIVALTLTEAPDGSGPTVAQTVLVDAPGLWDFDPEPVAVGHPFPDVAPAHEPTGDGTGLFRHHGLPIIDALLGDLEPARPKTVRTDIVGVRLLAPIPTARTARYPLELPDFPGASTTSLLPVAPSATLAELPLAPDGTFHARLPANLAFRIQNLDARGMTVGTQHNRWYDLLDGQVMTQGIGDAALYRARCAACHGALDGDPNQVFGVDAVSSASLTLSRFEGRNSRRPLPPLEVGGEDLSVITFVDHVGPLLEERCAGCHVGPSDPRGGGSPLDLRRAPTAHFDTAYESLFARGTDGGTYLDLDEGRARRSHLFERLLGLELDAPRTLTSATPHPNPPLSAKELSLLIRWLESGAAYRAPEHGAPR